MKHFKDCPTNRNYNMCTCDMMGEEIALVEWAIQKQEGTLKWWQLCAKLTVRNAPEIYKLKGI
jgi:hypothetical protein